VECVREEEGGAAAVVAADAARIDFSPDFTIARSVVTSRHFPTGGGVMRRRSVVATDRQSATIGP